MKLTRKAFLAGAAVCAAAPAFAKTPDEIRSVLLHWGLNMWGESLPPDIKGPLAHGRLCNDRVKFSDTAWNLLVDDMVAKKMNMVIIDLGEFPVYPSHPELALPGSRSPDWIRGEVRRLKKLGLEPIPKLNFSAARLKGFMMAPWANCLETSNHTNLEGIDLFAKALGVV